MIDRFAAVWRQQFEHWVRTILCLQGIISCNAPIDGTVLKLVPSAPQGCLLYAYHTGDWLGTPQSKECRRHAAWSAMGPNVELHIQKRPQMLQLPSTKVINSKEANEALLYQQALDLIPLHILRWFPIHQQHTSFGPYEKPLFQADIKSTYFKGQLARWGYGTLRSTNCTVLHTLILASHQRHTVRNQILQSNLYGSGLKQLTTMGYHYPTNAKPQHIAER